MATSEVDLCFPYLGDYLLECHLLHNCTGDVFEDVSVQEAHRLVQRDGNTLCNTMTEKACSMLLAGTLELVNFHLNRRNQGML
jgi:hypothetical protein